MNAKPIRRLLFESAVAALVSLAPGACVGAAFTEWQHRAPVVVTAPGLHRLALTSVILDAGRPGLEDLRLTDSSGNEVPFVAHIPRQESPASRAPKFFQPQLRNTSTLLTIETGVEAAIEGVTVESPGRAFIKSGRLEGSKDGRLFTTLVEGAPLFRQGNAANLTVRIPPGVWPWLRLTADDERSPPVPFTAAVLHTASAEVAPLERVSAVVKSTDHADGVTRLVLDLGAANLTLAELEIEAAEPLFQRRVNVRVTELAGEELREMDLATGVLYSVDSGTGAAVRQTRIAVNRQIRTRELIVLIDNGDSPPLSLGAVRLFRRPVNLLFQGTSPGVHHLFAGNPRCPAPRYDLGGLSERLNKAESVSLTPGSLEANPGFHRPEALPGLAETGAPMDTKAWRLRKPVTLRGGGVQQLELDLDVLSRARVDLADLRLIREGLQVPYLVERPSLSRTLAPAVRSLRDPKRPSVSRWELTLSHPHLPLTRMQCRSRTPLFQRRVRLFEQAPDGRGGKYERDLGSAPWQRSAEPGNPSLTLQLEGRAETAVLFLETDNGDNPSLELEDFTFMYPATRLVFKSVDAPELYYGNAAANAPRYDVALVASQLLAADRSPAAAGVEQPLKNATWTEGEPLSGWRGWIFWGVLVAVVAGLLGIIVKMLPKPPG